MFINVQSIGHGISGSFLDELRQVSREFFAQPMEEKKRYAKTVVEFEGYGADPVPEEGQSLDWSDRLYLNVQPADQRNYKLWPAHPDSFRCVPRNTRSLHRWLTCLILFSSLVFLF